MMCGPAEGGEDGSGTAAAALTVGSTLYRPVDRPKVVSGRLDGLGGGGGAPGGRTGLEGGPIVEVGLTGPPDLAVNETDERVEGPPPGMDAENERRLGTLTGPSDSKELEADRFVSRGAGGPAVRDTVVRGAGKLWAGREDEEDVEDAEEDAGWLALGSLAFEENCWSCVSEDG